MEDLGRICVTEFVPAVNTMVGICFFMAMGYIYYILKMAHAEMKDETTKQEELLQLSLFED